MNSIILATLLIYLQSFAEGKINNELWKDYYNHTLNMGCKIPQKRALPVAQFKANFEPKISDLEMEKLLPQSVIVSRCEDSGCCQRKHHVCGPATTTNLTLPFLAIKPLKFFTVKVENHVTCKCQRSKNHIK